MPRARLLPLAILALLTAPALAGCLAPTATLDPATVDASVDDVLARLSPVLGDLPIVHEVVDVETPHGLVNVDLYLPQVPEGVKMPLILVASPYNNANSPLSGGKSGGDNWISLPLYEWIRRELMPRGYAFAQMDILGTRNSGGCQGIMNEAERQATAAVVDHFGKAEWSNGKVGMIGKSYLGLSQMGAAVERPEHLVTIVPISGPTQDYAYHYRNGVPYRLNVLTNVLYLGAYSSPLPQGDPVEYAPRYPERFPCMPEAIAQGLNPLGDYNERWQARDYRPLIPQMSEDVSVFFIHGHQDWNVKPDHVLEVYDAFPGPKMALLGQWAHDYPNINNHDEDRYGEREDWYYQLHRWFDHWLLDLDTGIMDEAARCPVQTQGSDGVWRCLQDFPPKPEQGDPVETLTLYPQSSVLAAAPGGGTVDYTDAGTEDTGGFHAFRAEPAREAYRIAGTPNVTMRVSTTSAYNAHLVAALGIERDDAVEEFTWAFQSLRHRDGLEQGQPLVPGTRYEVTFDFYPVDHVVGVGERLVLVLRGVSDGPNGGILPNPVPGLQTVDLAGTALALPTVPLDRAFEPLTHADLPESYHQQD